MPDDLKARVLELVSIAKECPENLQSLCFELLLRDFLEGRTAAAADAEPPSERTPPHRDQPEDHQDLPAGETSRGQQDVKSGDLHMKVRKFMERHSITLDHLNQLFYKDGGEIRPLYEDLKTTRMAESQIRAALLQALLSAMRTGEFIVDGEHVRVEVQQRKAYDRPNFTTNFKNNANLFEGFQSYVKTEPLRLSEDGKKELAELIKELAR
jgi:hypothetical protein